MSIQWMRLASHLIPALLGTVAFPLCAQEPLTESRAIALALAQEGIAARDDADRAAAAAEVDVIGPLDNPQLEMGREGGGGEIEYQLHLVQPIDLVGHRAALRNAARADAEAIAGEIERRRQLLIADVRSAYVRCAAASAQAVTHIKHLQVAEGVTDLAEAVRRGSEERLVPILMTAISAGLALLPLAIAIGEPGSEIQAPMAIVILCGLTSSTVLNMLVLPAIYLKVTRDGWGVKWPAWRRREVPAE